MLSSTDPGRGLSDSKNPSDEGVQSLRGLRRTRQDPKLRGPRGNKSNAS